MGARGDPQPVGDLGTFSVELGEQQPVELTAGQIVVDLQGHRALAGAHRPEVESARWPMAPATLPSAAPAEHSLETRSIVSACECQLVGAERRTRANAQGNATRVPASSAAPRRGRIPTTELRTHVHRVALGGDRPSLQVIGLPTEQVVGHPLERSCRPSRSPSPPWAPRCRLLSHPVRRPWPHSAAQNDQVEGVDRLDLAPSDAPPTGFVTSTRSLYHDALMSEGNRVGGKPLGVVGICGDDRGKHRRTRQETRQQGPATGQRVVDQRGVIEVEDVEEVGLGGR